MSVSAYAYVNARIGGMKSHLLKEEDYQSLIEGRNLEEIASQLKGTPYGADLAEADVLSMELQLKKSLYRDYLKLVNCIDGKPKEFIHNMAKQFEVEALRSLIKMKFLGVTLDEYLIPFGQVDEPLIEQVMRAEGIYGLIEQVKGTEYYSPLKEAYESRSEKKAEEGIQREDEDLPYLSAVESYYFEGVKESMERLSRKDKGMVKRFVGFNIDLANLLMALRLKGVDGELESYFIEGGDDFTIKHFNWLRHLEDLSRLAELVPKKFMGLLQDTMGQGNERNTLLYFEISVKRKLLRESKKLFLGNRFHIGTIIAYLNLKENEISNLIKIIKTKDEFFPAKEIEELLVIA